MASTDTLYRMTPPGGALIVPPHGKVRRLPHIVYHSPDGFRWGYGGAGPADLALSLLRHHLGELRGGASPWYGANGYWRRRVEQTRAFALHQQFKWVVVAAHPADTAWELSGAEIAAWLVPFSPQKGIVS